MASETDRIPWPVLVDDWGRFIVRSYLGGSIACLTLFALITFRVEVPFPRWLSVLFAGLFVPLLFVGVGLLFRLRALRRGALVITAVDPDASPGWRGVLSQMRWLVATFVLFGVWSGGYFLTNHVVHLQEPTPLYFDLDAGLPRYSQFSLIYLTVFWFFLFPLLFGREKERFWPLLRAYGAVLAVCFTIFAVFPVEYPREPLVVSHLGDWTLGVIQGADPPRNCFPSSHCAMATLAALALWDRNPRLGLLGVTLAGAIAVATVLTKQHYVIDVVAGTVLGGAAYLHFLKPQLARKLLSLDWARR